MTSCTVEHILIEELIYFFFSINYVLIKLRENEREKGQRRERERQRGERARDKITKH